MTRWLTVLALGMSMATAGCSVATPGQSDPPAASGAPITAADRMLLTVHKSPTCGCCALWVDHVKASGLRAEIQLANDIEPVKRRVGVPAGYGSCHTAEVDGYFIEGHVPASDIQRLLKERPDALGLTLPGMPMGSPGMEVPSGEVRPYTVFLVHKDGAVSPFSEHGPR
jgi:hypothetical protein